MIRIISLVAIGGLSLLQPVHAQACSGALHLEVGPSGVYRLEQTEAVAVVPGLAGCPIANLAMTSHGKPVPVRVVDNGDGSFGAGDAIEWVGEQLHGPISWADPYSNVNVYALSASGEPARIQLATASAAHGTRAQLARKMHLERPNMMIRLTNSQVEPNTEPDVWYWSKLTMIDPQPFRTSFNLPGLDPRSDELTLKLAFRGLSSVRAQEGHDKPKDHRVLVKLNGRLLATLEWDGEDQFIRSLTVPSDLLRERDNELEMRVPERLPPWSTSNAIVDVVMFDYLEMNYPVTGAIGNGREPLQVKTDGAPRIEGATPVFYGTDGRLYKPHVSGESASYAQAAAGTALYPLAANQTPLTPGGLRPIAQQTDWRHPPHGYDYVMVAHPRLLEATKPLAKFHRSQGLKVALIDVREIYDQFHHGIVHPDAIHDLLAYAHESWPQPQPRFVLLVGDASFDIRHDQLVAQQYYSKWANRELLFPGRFGTIPGTEYENLPDSPGERNLLPTFQYYSYEGQSASDNGFVDFDPEGITPSMAIGRFPVVTPKEVTAIVNKTIAYARKPTVGKWRQSVMFITNDSTGFQTQSNQLANTIGKLGFTADKIYPNESDKDNDAHQKKIMQEINSGELLVHFLGHGGRYIWRTGPPDPRKNHDLFTLDDVAALDNASKLPMVLSMTCYSAPFDNPTEDSIGERFLREADKGAIAVFAASWRNAPDSRFSETLMTELLQPGVSIGGAILRAKQETGNHDMIGMYNLLGDPALSLQRPRGVLTIARNQDRWNPRVVVEVPDAPGFQGRLRVEWLAADNRVLQATTYRVESPRVTLPEAPTGADEVRIYARSIDGTRDALGQLKLETPPPQPSWWQKLLTPDPEFTPLQAAPDRIYGSNFGG